MEQTEVGRKREILTTLAVLIVIVVIVGAVTVTNKKRTGSSANSSTSATTQTTTNSKPADSSATSTATYKDGNYTATGSYESPGGSEQISVQVTLANDVVTSTSATNGGNDPEAQEYQDQFISGYKQLVVGKNIANIHVSRVSGSSLTSQGFNNAIAKIEQQAQA